MTWEAWLTLAVVAVAVVLLTREVAVPSGVVFGAVVVLLVAGVVTPAEAFSGFSNRAPITVAALFVLAAAVEKTGILTSLVRRVLGGQRGERKALGRLLIPAASTSAFLNNTPVVAMLVPAVVRWADRSDRSASRFLMPLSFAAVLGGMATVIGTSTNLVVSGLLEDAGLRPSGSSRSGNWEHRSPRPAFCCSSRWHRSCFL